MSEELNRLEQLFDAALGMASAEERADYLARTCGADTALRQRVEKLLRAHATAGQFLSPEASGRTGLPLTGLELPPSERPGDQIGHYTLLERIGEGSCCVVFRAEQTEPVHRQVALKLIKAGMDTRQVVARFEAERQALAVMDHPHIAKVFDAGVTSTGRPYFIMELVRGVPITQYCDQQRLTLKDRLRLFMLVCQAVQHAHQKGIIHRDLKPSNILVASDVAEPPLAPASGESEGARVPGQEAPASAAPSAASRSEPFPKIIDFGIAKAVQARLTHRAVATWVGQCVGTPAYMSPEQAGMNTEDIDVRSDVYSLGALLYELLTGVTPFDHDTLATGALDEIRRMIRETEPPKPSARLAELGGRLAEVAEKRRTEPATLRRSLRGDLDWIVMKALEKDRQRRYATAHDFAEDIQRHLAHEPVLAGPPGAGYRTGKFVRRHRLGVAVTAAVALALLAGLSLALVGLHRALQAEAAARRERDRAVQAQADTRVILDLFSDKLSAGDEMITLLQSSARIARERLGPTNPASLKFLLPAAHNLGRLAAWTNALEVYRWLIDTDPDNLDFWEQAHAAALAAPQPEAGRQLREAMVKRFGASRDPTNCLRLAQSLLVTPDYQLHLETAVACARQALEGREENLACRTVQGLAEYRRGNWTEALPWLEPAERDGDPSLASLASSFGAMARHQAGQAAEALAALDRASRHFRLAIQTGQLQAQDWHESVLACVALAQAERLVLGQEVSPPLTAGFLALTRETWKSVQEALAKGHALAGEARWKESGNAYAKALAHPLFDWGAAEEQSLGRCLSIEMGTVFARCGDSTNHERLCRLLLARHPEKPITPKEEDDATVMANRYARTCFMNARNLSPEVQQKALALARFALTNQERRNDHNRGWVCQTTGIAEYYAGQLERALELLRQAETSEQLPIKGPAMLYRAMALNKTGRSQEAAQVLHDAEPLGDSPELNLRDWWFNGELYRLALEEARRAIRPAP